MRTIKWFTYGLTMHRWHTKRSYPRSRQVQYIIKYYWSKSQSTELYIPLHPVLWRGQKNYPGPDFWSYMCASIWTFLGLLTLNDWTNMNMGNILFVTFSSVLYMAPFSLYFTKSTNPSTIMMWKRTITEPRNNLDTRSYHISITLSQRSSRIHLFCTWGVCKRIMFNYCVRFYKYYI